MTEDYAKELVDLYDRLESIDSIEQYDFLLEQIHKDYAEEISDGEEHIHTLIQSIIHRREIKKLFQQLEGKSDD